MDGIDNVLKCLAHPRRRAVVVFVDEVDDDTIPVNELSKRIAASTECGVDKTTLRVSLHHVHLPKLEDAGVLEYDAKSETIGCREPPPVVADLIEVCTAYE